MVPDVNAKGRGGARTRRRKAPSPEPSHRKVIIVFLVVLAVLLMGALAVVGAIMYHRASRLPPPVVHKKGLQGWWHGQLKFFALPDLTKCSALFILVKEVSTLVFLFVLLF